VDAIVRWAFAAFLFSIPFETLDPGIAEGSFSLSKLTGYVFILMACLQPKTSFRRFPAAFWCFSLYLAAYVLAALYQGPEYRGEIIQRLLTLVQMLMLLWISSNLLRSEQTVRHVLGAFSAACALLSVLQLIGITSVTYRGGENRISALGEQPNIIAAVLALGLLTLVTFARDGRLRPFTLLAWPCGFLIIVAIVDTGSRGVPVALAAGIMALAFGKSAKRTRVRNALIVLFVLGVIGWLSYSEQNIRDRWLKTFEHGSMAGRERLFPLAWQMFLERPLVGWGPVANYKELSARMQLPVGDPHNLYLWVLTEVGLAGGLPYFVGLLFCLLNAWKGRHGPQGILPLALLLTVLVNNMATSWHQRKLHWLVLGYALAAVPWPEIRRLVIPPWARAGASLEQLQLKIESGVRVNRAR
jgi:O-antigen ligase